MLRVELDRSVAEVTIDNPPANALTNELYERLSLLLDDLERDRSARVVLFLSDHPTIFVAGADINAMRNYDFSAEAIERKVKLVHGTFLKLQRFSKPTVVSIEGHALGGGCELALSLDARFMTAGKARIGLPEARLGIIPGGGGTQRLARLVGRGNAAQMMMLGEGIDAGHAERIGLVNAACPDPESTRERARDYARRLTEMPSSSLRLIKTCLNDGYDAGLIAGLEVERRCVIEALLAPEAKEGIAAFVDKRPARFHEDLA
ncbi:MAG TPA: enoyl-CoA hydratase/isomerase family protein [Solirubrobacteraceae bacterium]|nr:enoyl-CoA hydratase/isomerase family protein [Solirubrobacteraceae bacterium]